MTDYSDLTNVAVVRDRDGVMWGVVGPDRWLSLDGSGVRIGAEGLSLHHGPLAPLLDLDGQPIVRTVGDLTARHIGKRVRVEGCEYTLDHIGPSKCLFILGPGGYFPGQQFPLDTPCEVLP